MGPLESYAKPCVRGDKPKWLQQFLLPSPSHDSPHPCALTHLTIHYELKPLNSYKKGDSFSKILGENSTHISLLTYNLGWTSCLLKPCTLAHCSYSCRIYTMFIPSFCKIALRNWNHTLPLDSTCNFTSY